LPDALLPGFEPTPVLPQTDADWYAKWIEVSELFSPSAPVRESDLFVGRQTQIARITEGIFQAGQHV